MSTASGDSRTTPVSARDTRDWRSFAREIGGIVGEQGVFWRRADILPYDADGFVYDKLLPDLVVLPRTTQEVSAVLCATSAARVPLIARGAGTGLAGGCLAERGGVVLSLARMDRVLEVRPEDRVAVVQPGVVNTDLTAAVAGHGLYYAPDPSSQMSSTIGGNFGTNAGGPHCLKYGQTHRHILGATVVLADGEIVHLGGGVDAEPAGPALAVLVGNEGTLAVATEITVRLLRKPETVRTFLSVFDSVEQASHVVSDVIAAGILPAALEMLDHLTIAAVEPYVKVGLPLDAGAALLIELDGPSAGMDRRAREIRALCEKRGTRDFREAKDDAERALLWKARKGAFGAMGRIATGFYIMDGVVPRTRLPEALRRIDAICEARGLKVANVFHAGDGNLHPNVIFDVDDPDQVRRAIEASHEILRTCVELGGSLSGEHGIGNEKRELMGWVYTDDDLDAMRRVKKALDPHDLLNPDKLFPIGEGMWSPRVAAPAPGAWM